MIDIYQTVNVTSGGKRLYLAVDHASKEYSEPSRSLPTQFHYVQFSSRINLVKSGWIRIGSVPSLPIDPSLYPELFI